MKYLISLSIMVAPLLVFAEKFPGGNQQQMQAMMQKAQEMQACMKNVDQGKLRTFEQKAKQMGSEIKALCAAGNRSAALSKAMSFKNEMENDSSLQEIKKCGEMMKGFMPDMSEMAHTYTEDNSKGDICDN